MQHTRWPCTRAWPEGRRRPLSASEADDADSYSCSGRPRHLQRSKCGRRIRKKMSQRVEYEYHITKAWLFCAITSSHWKDGSTALFSDQFRLVPLAYLACLAFVQLSYPSTSGHVTSPGLYGPHGYAMENNLLTALLACHAEAAVAGDLVMRMRGVLPRNLGNSQASPTLPYRLHRETLNSSAVHSGVQDR